MLSEANEAKKFLVERFGNENLIPAGTYPVPTQTSKGPAFMKVKINKEGGMNDFSLWMRVFLATGIV